jgi:phosphoribosylformylglycinamidine cyclo-ligase
MSKKSEYERLGVDAYKRDVRYLKKLVAEAFPYTFTPLLKDPDRNEYFILHIDGAGSKPIISYLYYKEINDTSFFRGLSQDVIAMNLDDIITVGAEPVAFADYIAVNPFRVPKAKILQELSIGFKEVFNILSGFKSGIRVSPLFSGGETADLPDQVRTLDIVGMLYARVTSSKIIKGDIHDKALIIGLRSSGKAKYEKKENSGIMCNGLTLARHVLLSKYYREKYPEVYEPLVEQEYRGRYNIDSYVDELGMSIGEALLSPTRIFAPIIGEIMDNYREHIMGMVHITGGGLTKFLRLGSGLKYILNNLPDPDPLFNLIKREGKISWKEMYEVFNMGVGFGIIIDDNKLAEDVICISEKYNVEARIIGFVEKGKEENTLIIKKNNEQYLYSLE